MSYHFSTERGVNWFAEKWVRYNHPELSQAEKLKIFPHTKYNVLAGAFNFATAMLVGSIAMAFFSTISTAVFIGGLSLLVRHTVEKELDKFTVVQPVDAKNTQWSAVAETVQKAMEMTNFVYKYVSNQTREEDKEAALSEKLGGKQPENWAIDKVVFFGHVLWKNLVHIPEIKKEPSLSGP